MDAILQEALGPRRWRLEFKCEGRAFVWTGKAPNQAAAEQLATADLAASESDFRPAWARLASCVEVMT
jgi:hypothetical protein